MKYLAKFFAATALLAVIGMLVVRLWPVSLAEPKLLVRVPAGASLKVAAQTFNNFDIKISTIARGVGFGDDLEYTDEVTLGRSIQNRQPFVPFSK